MLSFKVIVCVVVTLVFIGCAHNDTQSRPETTAATAGSSGTPGSPGATAGGPASGDASVGSGTVRGTPGPADAGGPTVTALDTTSGEHMALNDRQIAAITEAANDGEIAQGKVAQGKARNARVKAFASKMIAHHGQAKEKQSKLGIATADSPLSKKLKEDGAATLASLNAAPAGPAFDQAYIKAQIDGHQKLLDAINDRLLPNVKDEKLAAYVKDIKPKVEAHLKEARDIEQALNAAPSLAAAGGAGAGSTARQ